MRRVPGFWVRGAAIAALGLAVTPMGAQQMAAQEEWKPFEKADRPARSRRGAAATEAPGPPPLTPMDGILYGRERAGEPRDPSAVPTQGSTAPGGGYGQAYPGLQEQLPYGGQPPPVMASPNGLSSVRPGASAGVERQELEPVKAADGSGLALDTWRGMDLKTVEGKLARLQMPPRSPVMSGLFRQLFTAQVDPPVGVQPGHWKGITLEVLYRSGLIADMGKRMGPETGDGDPIATAFRLRHDLARGDRVAVCVATKSLMQKRGDLPKALSGELHLLSGYCAAADGNTAGAGLAAELAREDGVDAPLAFGALEALSGSGKTGMPAPKRVLVLDYRLLELMGPVEAAQVLERAEPALLTAIAMDAKAEPKLRVAAAELAAAATAITPGELADVYRSAPADSGGDTLFRRANLYKSVEGEATPGRKLAAARALLDDARRTALYLQVAAMLAPALDAVPPGPDQGAEAAVETALAVGNVGRARAWTTANPGLRHWQALIDLIDPALRQGPREDSLAILDETARRGRFGADTLHRLATVLDALDVNVPIPLWEAASKAPQPNAGHLPDTGVLPELQDAAKKKEPARTVLLTLQALGGTAKSAHILALGDSMRALRRAGFAAQARTLGVEALLADWPRGGGA